MSGRSWSDYEINILKKYFKQKKISELLKYLPGRNIPGIKSKASDLGLKKENYYWSEEELNLLKKSFSNTKNSELKKLFPLRTLGTIYQKVKDLGLKKEEESFERSTPWTEEEIKILKENYSLSTRKEITKLIPNRDPSNIGAKASRLNIKKEKNAKNKTREETNLERHGVRFISQSEIMQKNLKKNCIKKYGVDHHTKTPEYKKMKEDNWMEKCGVKTNLQLEDTKEKIRKTNLDRYGFPNVQQNKKVREKKENTNTLVYGSKSCLSNPVIRQKIKDTFLKKYNEDCNLKVPEVKEQIRNTNIDRYGYPCPLQNKDIRQKQKDTCLTRYGKEYAIGSEEVQEKIRETNNSKRGVSYPFQLLDIQKKVTSSKTINGSHNTSKPEDDIYLLIKRIYPNLDIERNYSKDARYPFSCDYYIKELDAFIEYQGTWTHGRSPYSVTEDISELKEKAENNSYYKSALETYTCRDPLKRSYASKNNLNFLEIWPSDIKKGEKWLTFLFMKIGLTLKYNSQTLKNEFESIAKKYTFSDDANYNKIVENFQPHFYKEERLLWNSPEKRENLIDNRVYYKKKDYLDLTNKQILQGFKISGIHNGFSFFSTSWIRSFIEKYKISSVYDPCMGWGHRLLGAKDITYIGNDSCKETVKGNLDISCYFNMKNKIFYNMQAEKFIPSHEYDAVFTCPPYFKIEIYDGSETSTKRYPNYDYWLNSWWRNVIRCSIFNKPKYFSFVINNKYRDDMLRVCIEEKLELIEEIKVGSRKLNHFQRKCTNSYKGEKLLIFNVKDNKTP